MKYRQTFREALKDVGIKDKTEEKPVDDKDATIEKLKDELQLWKVKYQELKIDRSAAVPDKETGEVPLRTGVAAALLDKKGPSPKIKKDNKKLKMSLGKSKIKVDPDVPIGQISGGIQTGTGNLH
jgi:hypothetical protein|tara:strand:+ start:92 stop:466 length:375 start_codon:yes stop_codon:yes gene_type:complete